MKEQNKPDEVMQKIVDGKLEKFYEEVCLMEQPFVKDGDRKISQLVIDATAKMGERVFISRFARFVLGN